MGLVQAGAHAGLGSADQLLDLTPYQLLRLLTPTQPSTPDAPASSGGTARLQEIRGMLV